MTFTASQRIFNRAGILEDVSIWDFPIRTDRTRRHARTDAEVPRK